MDYFFEILTILILALDFSLVASSRLLHCIQLVAAQGICLGCLTIVHAVENQEAAYLALCMGTVNLLLKGAIIPLLLSRTMRAIKIPREVEPLLGYPMSSFIGLLLTGGAYLICRNIDFGSGVATQLHATVAFATMGMGLFLIVSRRKAIMQALGFLVFENGITLFGLCMGLEYSIAVELGILLDVFVLVFIMGIAMFQINREFRHIDADRLNCLGDRSNAGKDFLNFDEEGE